MFDTSNTLRAFKRSLICAALAVFVTPLLPATTRAWGREGHNIVAIIAERHLSAAVRTRLNDILQNEQQMNVCGNPSALSDKLVCASTWADWSRDHTHKNTYNWHFVDIWLSDPNYVPSRDCSPDEDEAEEKGTCGLDGLERSVGILRGDSTDPNITRSQALMFIVHIVGDLHQPFHTVRDRTGGNGIKVKYFNVDSDMHKVWDTKLIQSRWINLNLGVPQYARRLADQITPADKSSYQQGDPVTWLVAAHGHAKRDGYDQRFVDGTTGGGGSQRPWLRGNYFQHNWPIAEAQLKRGGVRLAKILNDALG